jgi:hypothetical protein
MIFFFQYSTPLVGMRFWGHVPNSLREAHSLSTLKNGFFGLQNSTVPLGCRKKKNFFWSTLNIMILQTMRNECVRFGGHVDIEVNYKIIQLDVVNETLICTIYLALNRGYF